MLLKVFLVSLFAIAQTLATKNVLPLPKKPALAECGGFGNDDRFDCFPQGGVTQESCEARGCCWVPAGFSLKPAVNGRQVPLDVPWCFYPKVYGGYQNVNISDGNNGQTAFYKRTFQSSYPRDVDVIKFDVESITENTVRIKISDPSNQRYETPYPKITAKAQEVDNPLYKVNIDPNKVGFQVTRSSGRLLLNAQDLGGFIFSDQFIQISTTLSGVLYGIGEHRTTLWLDPTWTSYTLFNRDQVPAENVNLYGSHPFYMVVEADGSSHGVYLHNSNAMDILTQPLPAVTFRTIGGIFDLYVFLGPSPADVIRQYTALVGRPEIPPYWGLGFQLCRYGYGSTAATRAAWQRTIDAGIPFDVQWNDIDYMITQNDFTIDPVNFAGLKEFVDDIHAKGMHYVPILDPGVSASEPAGTYPAYDDGVKKDAFVKDKDGNVFIGKTWNPVSTAYPDFTSPNAEDYWGTLIRDLYAKLPFDGLWIDMNEPSNFLDGTVNGCPSDELEHPMYTPGVTGGFLSSKTICMNAKQSAGLHYNVHNIYGIAEADVTNRALRSLGKRPFVISRSTFAGSGHYTGHWGGDNVANWYDLTKSIPEMLTFSLYGIPFMGSDICGFRDNTWTALCNRWMQLGAFYPFSRNHNTAGTSDQDPAILGDQVIASSKKALGIRYTLLPYLYTLFYQAHVQGDTVIRPLFFEFPSDANTYKVDRSFLWGSGIYIVPVTEEESTSVKTYLPAGNWYLWGSFDKIESSGNEVTLDAPLDTIPVLLREGTIIPTQAPALTTTESRKNGFTLLAIANTEGNANGTLYWDDGDSMDPVEKNVYGLISFTMGSNQLKGSVTQWNSSHTPKWEAVKLIGSSVPNKVTVNGADAVFDVNSNKVVTISGLNIPLDTELVVEWT